MIANYLGQSIRIASPTPLLTLCCQTPRPDSSKEMTLQLRSLRDCSLISVWNQGVFPTAFSHGSVKGAINFCNCTWCTVGMPLINDRRDLAHQTRGGEGETLTMQRPLNCTFHDTARTKVWCSLQRRRRQTGRKIH